MKTRKTISILLIVVMLLCCAGGCAPTAAPAAAPAAEAAPAAPASEPGTTAAADVDWQNWELDVSKIPQEKLDTTLYCGVAVAEVGNEFLAAVAEGLNIFGAWLDSIGQKHELQVMTYGTDYDKHVNDAVQFSNKAAGNGILYNDPATSVISALCDAMGQNGNLMTTAYCTPVDEWPWDYNPEYTLMTTPPQAEAAALVTEELCEAMDYKGQFFILEGSYAEVLSVERTKGCESVLAKYPDIEVVAQDVTNWDLKTAQNLVETWLIKYPDVKGIFCACDNVALGAIQALENAGLAGKVAVGGIDGITNFAEAIIGGNGTASIFVNGFELSAKHLATMYAQWTGLLDIEEVPHEYRVFYTGVDLVNKENAEYYMNYPEPTYEELDLTHPFKWKSGDIDIASWTW